MLFLRATTAWLLAALTAFWAIAGGALHDHAPHAGHDHAAESHGHAHSHAGKCGHAKHSHVAAAPRAANRLSAAPSRGEAHSDCVICRDLAQSKLIETASLPRLRSALRFEFVSTLPAAPLLPLLRPYLARGPPALSCG